MIFTTKLSREDKSEVIKRICAGEKHYEVAKAFDISRSYISKILHDNGIKLTYNKVCEFCGKEFHTSKTKQIYCSDKCRTNMSKSNFKRREKESTATKNKGIKKTKKKEISDISGWAVVREDKNARLTRKCIEAKKLGMSYGNYVRWCESNKIL